MSQSDGPARERSGFGTETRILALAGGSLLLIWVIAYAALRSTAVLWVGVGLAVAYLVFVALLHLLVFGRIRRHLREARSRLGDDAAALCDGSDGIDELLGVLQTMLHGSRDGADLALENDLLRLQADNRQLVEVASIGRDLNAALPYRETIERSLTRTKAFLRADFVALLTREPDGGFRLDGSLGVRSRSLNADDCRGHDDCPLQRAVSGERLMRTTGHRCGLFPHTMTHQLALPLPVPNLGQMVLLATSTTGTHLDATSDEALETLSGDVVNALATARKYDSIRRQVVTDHLTRLYNRRHFVGRAQEEVERSLREQAPMSIVMVDIDHFKRFNDTYGHATGDRVLQAVAAQLQDAVRTTDVCARYGGEEFTLLLPNTPGENAVFMAERVRRTLSNTRYTGLGLPADAAITISCGVATCPRDATAVDDLLELADQALYAAKADGRDCVRQFEPAERS
jgi:diguanylate cyclase (GGDEF)-like protein